MAETDRRIGGRIGQISRIELMNTMTYLDSMRYWLVEYGGYSDAEVDVLSEWRK